MISLYHQQPSPPVLVQSISTDCLNADGYLGKAQSGLTCNCYQAQKEQTKVKPCHSLWLPRVCNDGPRSTIKGKKSSSFKL